MRAIASSMLLCACAIVAAACSAQPSSAVDGGDAAIADGAIADLQHCLIVDDMDITHGCNQGGMGPGDRDDGGGAPAAQLPDASGTDLPFGAECDNNMMCASGICFDYRVKGFFCTQLCDTNADCPASSLGCSGQGVCRVGD